MTISGSIKKDVEAGEGYIFFTRKTNSIAARTREFVVVEAGRDNTFRFSDNTLIVEASNPDNTGTMKDLISNSEPAVTNIAVDTYSALANAIRRVSDATGGTFVITVTGNITFDYTIQFSGNGKKITVEGDNIPRSIFNTDGFIASNGVTLELGNNIILNRCPVKVERGGTFIMNNGSTVTGYSSWYGVESQGTFTMNGGTISGNNGGVIVYGGTFTMSGGTINDNETNRNGGGVCVTKYDDTMSGTFLMTGGIITGNSAKSDSHLYLFGNGGGVYVAETGSFLKTGGIIDDTNEADQGKVAYAENGDKKRETTSGLSDLLDSSKTGSVGGWEN